MCLSDKVNKVVDVNVVSLLQCAARLESLECYLCISMLTGGSQLRPFFNAKYLRLNEFAPLPFGHILSPFTIVGGDDMIRNMIVPFNARNFGIFR